jgi:hypothetical protein
MSDVTKQLASKLYTEIKRICAPKEIEVGFDEGNPSAQSLNCTITNGQVSLILEMNVLDAVLSISELAYRALIPGEPIPPFRFTEGALCNSRYVLGRSGEEFGWRENGKITQPFLAVPRMAEICVSRFLALVQRYDGGQIKRDWLNGPATSREVRRRRAY